MDGLIIKLKTMDPWNLVCQFGELCVNLLQLIYWYVEALYRLFVPPPMKSIDGEVILVTGAAGGIGSEICRYIVKCGTNIKLVMCDLQIEELNCLAQELKTMGKNNLEIFCYAVDISKRENIDSCCNLVKKEVGPVTIIFNNAGIIPRGNFLELSNHQIEQTIQVNLLSHFWILRQFLPEMVKTNYGRIINVCSVAGMWGGRCSFPYYASKFGVNGYTEALKTELEHSKCDGIHCTTVYPGLVQTPMVCSLMVDETKQVNMPSYFQKFLKPDEVAVKIVDGMRREYEFIYLPSILPLLRFREYLTPNKYNKSVVASYCTKFVFKDEEEQKVFETPLSKDT